MSVVPPAAPARLQGLNNFNHALSESITGGLRPQPRRSGSPSPSAQYLQKTRPNRPEGGVNKDSDNSDMRVQNRALAEENQRLSELNRTLLSSDSSTNFLDDLAKPPNRAQQQQVRQRPPVATSGQPRGAIISPPESETDSDDEVVPSYKSRVQSRRPTQRRQDESNFFPSNQAANNGNTVIKSQAERWRERRRVFEEQSDSDDAAAPRNVLPSRMPQKPNRKICYTISEDCTEEGKLARKNLCALIPKPLNKATQKKSDARLKPKPFQVVDSDVIWPSSKAYNDGLSSNSGHYSQNHDSRKLGSGVAFTEEEEQVAYYPEDPSPPSRKSKSPTYYAPYVRTTEVRPGKSGFPFEASRGRKDPPIEVEYSRDRRRPDGSPPPVRVRIRPKSKYTAYDVQYSRRRFSPDEELDKHQERPVNLFDKSRTKKYPDSDDSYYSYSDFSDEEGTERFGETEAERRLKEFYKETQGSRELMERAREERVRLQHERYYGKPMMRAGHTSSTPPVFDEDDKAEAMEVNGLTYYTPRQPQLDSQPPGRTPPLPDPGSRRRPQEMGLHQLLNSTEGGKKLKQRLGGNTEPMAHGLRPAGVQASSYWSISEQDAFPGLLKAYGSDWHAMAAHMGSKTAVMVKNYYLRQRDSGKAEWGRLLQEADAKKSKGEKRPGLAKVEPMPEAELKLGPTPIRPATRAQHSRNDSRYTRGDSDPSEKPLEYEISKAEYQALYQARQGRRQGVAAGEMVW